MNIKIIKGNAEEHLNSCKSALINSELGNVFFTAEEKAVSVLSEGFLKGEIFVAMDLNQNDKVLGFIWFTMDGVFHAFPYVHLLAVKQEYRGLGIGTKLLEYYEDEGFREFSKLFMAVSDFNLRAKKLYLDLGYKEVGKIPNLYKDGVDEILLMKER